MCSTVLDVISSLYHQDSANYFILEPQNTMSQFAEKIYTKPADLQVGVRFYCSKFHRCVLSVSYMV